MPMPSLHRPCSIDDELVTPSSDDKFDHLTNFNHMSGSYNNLYREKYDDDQNDISPIANAQNVSTPNLNKTSEIVENVYCNIPSQYGGLPSSNLGSGNSPCESSNPNMHLYSNVSLATAEAQDAAAAIMPIASTPLSSSSSSNPHNRNASQSTTKIKSGPMASMTASNSLLISDDLDLDDPVMAVGTTPVKRSTNQSNVDSATSSNSARKPAPVSIELKQVTDSTTMKGDHRQNNNPNGAIDVTMNSSRLLLHDTMIDTALDLDSLDVMNDNSQTFLMNRKPIA